MFVVYMSSTAAISLEFECLLYGSHVCEGSVIQMSQDDELAIKVRVPSMDVQYTYDLHTKNIYIAPPSHVVMMDFQVRVCRASILQFNMIPSTVKVMACRQ